jgi:hypothetical protein
MIIQFFIKKKKKKKRRRRRRKEKKREEGSIVIKDMLFGLSFLSNWVRKTYLNLVYKNDMCLLF